MKKMKKIEAYVTTDNTLFRVEREARDYEERKKLVKTLNRLLYTHDDLIGGEELYRFIKTNRDTIMLVLSLSYDFMARWAADRK